MEISELRVNHELPAQTIAAGTIGDIVDVSSRTLAHVVVEGVSGTNVIEVRARIEGGPDNVLATITGNTTKLIIDVEQYDEFEFFCTTFSAAGTPLIRASFFIFTKVTDVVATPSGLTTAGVITEVPLTAGAWAPLPAAPLADRNSIGIQNTTAIEIKLNFATPGGFVGWSVKANGEFFIDITDSITINAKAASGTPTITVMEIS